MKLNKLKKEKCLEQLKAKVSISYNTSSLITYDFMHTSFFNSVQIKDTKNQVNIPTAKTSVEADHNLAALSSNSTALRKSSLKRNDFTVSNERYNVFHTPKRGSFFNSPLDNFFKSLAINENCVFLKDYKIIRI